MHLSLIKHLTVLFPALLTGLKLMATSIIVTGNVSGSWTADTVFVEGNLTIPQGEILVITPGTFIQFQSYFRIDVSGSIKASGLPGDTIIFTIRDTSNFNAQAQGRGGWSGIRFRQISASEDSSVFSYCRFEFSKATEDSANCYGGAILAYGFSKLRFENCAFFHNYSYYSGGAVYLNASNAKVNHCSFLNNYAGNTGTIYGYGGGICSMNCAPQISHNEFYANSSTGVGGAVSFDNSNPVFENNVMQYNYSALGGALGVLRSYPSSTLSNNLITYNHALFFGGGICCIRSYPVFSNFTISDNEATYAGGLYCNDSAAPRLYNSVIYENAGFGASVYIWDIYSAPSFYYCNIDGDTTGFEGSGAHLGYHGEYLNNINENPEFIKSGLFPFQLLPSSPCIDKGTPDAGFLDLPNTDLAGAARISNSHIDMGAYEFNGTTGGSLLIEKHGSLTAYPNPFYKTVTIESSERMQRNTDVFITDLQGKIVSNLVLIANELSVQWDGTNNHGTPVSSGIYLVQLVSSGRVYQCKVVK